MAENERPLFSGWALIIVLFFGAYCMNASCDARQYEKERLELEKHQQRKAAEKK